MEGKNVYQMKGKEFVPFLGSKRYTNRIINYWRSNGIPKEIKEIEESLKGSGNSLMYHSITGVITGIGLGIGVFQGLVALLK